MKSAGITRFLQMLLLCLLLAMPAAAAFLSDPAVDAYNVRVGTQTFSGLYRFTTNTLLVETAHAISQMGSGVIKFYLGTEVQRQSGVTLKGNVTNLLTLVRDEPSHHRVLDMPFQHFVMWAYPFANFWPFDGYSATERANEYREIYDLTRYLLTNYNNSGKTFYLGHWEGDWYLLPNYNAATNPTPTAIQGMIDWLNNRQKAVDDAKAASPHSNVDVFNFAEVNRVVDAMSGNMNINQRAINKVVPYVTNLDCVSYSSYDVMDASASTLWSTLDYMRSMMPTNKAGVVPGQRLWIGEYGWGGFDNATQEQKSRAYIQRLLNWAPAAPRFILFWEIYNNETNRAFWLIDSNNVKVASWHLHQRFLNSARLSAARFKERNGRLPTDTEFGPLVSPMLSQPLPPPVNLIVSNLAATLTTPVTASVSGTLTQEVYGDDCAAVRVFCGRSDAGTNRNAWESSLFVAVNTNFNSATFTAVITNLVPGTNYFFRYYATNASGEAWAPVSKLFSTAALNPAEYGSQLRIALAGYNRGERLENFPLLVRLGPGLAGFSYRQFASPVGGDLRFADGGGLTPLSFEIDEWNTNGTSSVWVRVPMLAGTNDFILAYWGNPMAATLPPSSTNGTVWSSDHFLVYHLKEGGFPYADSVRQHPAVAGLAPSSASGPVGRGCRFDGVSQFLASGVVSLGDTFTLSAWVNLDSSASDIRAIWANKPGGYASGGFALFVNSYQTSDRKLILETGNGTTGTSAATPVGAVSAGQWHQITAVVDRAGGAARLYVDGSDLTDVANVRTDLATQNPVNLGRFTSSNFYWKGTLDEVRIAPVVRSADWIWASWMTVASNAALATYSSVVKQPLVLSIDESNQTGTLHWPAYAVDAVLYTTTNLASPLAWTRVTNQPVLISSQWEVALPIESGQTCFYQLQSRL